VELIASGLSFHSAPLDIRERAAIPESRTRTTLRFLVGHSGLGEAAVLSTCNRTEFYLTSPHGGIAQEVSERLARYLDPSGIHGVADHLVTRTGADALSHMFQVASGLDSMVLGEAQILGQFKSAHRLAREAGTLDYALDFVMKRAVSVGKRVRTETGIGHGRASIGELAVSWARQTLGGLAGRRVLLVGAGEVSGVVARRMASSGAALLITSRGSESAPRLAAELGAAATAIDDVDGVVDGIDLMICSTSSLAPVMSAADVARIQSIRNHRPLGILDIAVPRDVESDAASVAGVHLTDLDALGQQMQEALSGRGHELPAAQAIVDSEVAPTISLLDERDATAPTIAALTRRAETLRRAEVERSLARMPELGDDGREQLDALTRSLVRKLLHAPISHLKEQSDDPGVALLLREAFDLDEDQSRDGRRPRG
jgi:glutamyl-tRNA reductase